MNKAVFLDRDGTIIKDSGYTYKIEDLKFLRGSINALRILKGFKLIIVTNQSGIGRGYYTTEDFIKLNNYMVNELDKKGISIEETYFCPHKPEDMCDCRKPNITFIKDAEKRYDIDLSKSYVIGDHPGDIEMGRNAGCKTVFVLTGHGKKHKDCLAIKPDSIAKNLLEAAKNIAEENEKR